MNYKHKRFGWIATKDKYKRYHVTSEYGKLDYVPAWAIEENDSWEKIEECILPVGAKFQNKNYTTIYTISKIENDTVYFNNNQNSLEGSRKISKFNENVRNGDWIEAKEELCVPIGTKFRALSNNVYAVDKVENDKVYYSDGTRIIDKKIAEFNSWIKNGDIKIYEETFLTEDGAKLKKGDSVYFVLLSNSKVYGDYTVNEFHINGKMHEDRKFFSTEELADKYANEIKPQFSLKDIKEVIGQSVSWRSLVNKNDLIEEFQKLKDANNKTTS